MSREITRARAKAKRDGWNPDWIRSEADANAVLKHGCVFSEARAVRVRNFFTKLLRHSKGQWAGQPFSLLDWQWNDVIAPLYGWIRPDGTRRYQRAHIEIPKKNGKSTMAAGLSLYHLFADGEPGAEVYNAAGDRAQASIVFNEASNMLRASPILSERVGREGIVDSRKTIVDRKTNSRYQALSADVPTKEGLNISALIFDELHAQKKRDLWDTLRYGGAARRQPLTTAITTAGVYDPAAIGWEQHEYARQVLDGAIEDEAFFAYMRGAEKDDNWQDPKVWAAVNPSWAITINPDMFKAEAEEAKANPATENNFRRYRLNQWVQQVTRWLPLHVWDANQPAHHAPLTEDALLGRTCYGGLDLASVSDLTPWLLLFPCEDEEGAVDVLLRCWVPEAQVSNPRNRNRHLYEQWVRDGYLQTTPGNTVDYGFIKKAVLADAQRFNLASLAIDRLFQGQQLAQELDDELGTGYDGKPRVFPMGMGYVSFAAPMAALDRLIKDHRVHHGGNPLLRWTVDHVVVRMDPAGNLKPDKEKSAEKIDPFVTLVMAIEEWSRHPEGIGQSVYEEHGVEFLAY